MKSFIEIIEALNRAEVSLIERFFRFQENRNKGKRQKLFRLIKDKKVNSDVQAAKILYQSKPNAAYSNLKNRFKQDILNLLLLSDYSKSRSDSDSFLHAKINCCKLITQAQILLSKEAVLEAEKILVTAKELAIKHGLTSEKVILEELLADNQYSIMGDKGHVKYMLDLKEDVWELQQILIVKECYYKLLNTAPNSEIDEGHVIGTLKGIKALYDKTSSCQVRYWYFNLFTAYYKATGNLEQALRMAKTLSKLTEDHQEMFSEAKKIHARLQIGIMYLHLGNYNEATLHITGILDTIEPGKLSCLKPIEVLIHTHFYNQRIPEAENLINTVLAHPKLNVVKQVPIKCRYYLANIEFAKGNFTKSTILLTQGKWASGDKESWLNGHRLLELLNFIELGKHDLVEYRLSAFKQLLMRRKDNYVKRYQRICKIINTLIIRDYDYCKTLSLHWKDFIALSAHNTKSKWVPLNNELVRFESWIVSKAAGTELSKVLGSVQINHNIQLSI